MLGPSIFALLILVVCFSIGFTGEGEKWFARGGGGSFEPLEGGGGGVGKVAPVADLLLNPYLGFLSTPIWALRWQGLCSHFAHMWAPRSAGVM